MRDIDTIVYEITGEVAPTIADMNECDSAIGREGIDWTDRDTGRAPDKFAHTALTMGDVVIWDCE